jgi:hypothetical protein
MLEIARTTMGENWLANHHVIRAPERFVRPAEASGELAGSLKVR